jgi:zinc transport system substrate-binding protein
MVAHRFSAVILVLVFLLACAPSGPRQADGDSVQVTVSILPQYYFVKRIAGDTVKIHVMIPPGHNPHSYEPSPQQIKALVNSKMYFRIGHIPFEKAWMKRLAEINPNMSVVDTSSGVQLIGGQARQTIKHHHQGEHNHSGVDPHIWLSPSAVRIQLKHIMKGLCQIQPDKKEIYQKNREKLLADINNLDKTIKKNLADIQSRKILVYHPAWGYLAREYQLSQIAIEDQGKEPNPSQLKELIRIAKREKIRVIIVQKQFDVHNAQTIAREINGRVIALDPLARDWLQNMWTIARALMAHLKNE